MKSPVKLIYTNSILKRKKKKRQHREPWFELQAYLASNSCLKY
jgi:hypothetical protein